MQSSSENKEFGGSLSSWFATVNRFSQHRLWSVFLCSSCLGPWKRRCWFDQTDKVKATLSFSSSSLNSYLPDLFDVCVVCRTSAIKRVWSVKSPSDCESLTLENTCWLCCRFVFSSSRKTHLTETFHPLAYWLIIGTKQIHPSETDDLSVSPPNSLSLNKRLNNQFFYSTGLDSNWNLCCSSGKTFCN